MGRYVLKLLENARLHEIKVKPTADGFRCIDGLLEQEKEKEKQKKEPELIKFDVKSEWPNFAKLSQQHQIDMIHYLQNLKVIKKKKDPVKINMRE